MCTLVQLFFPRQREDEMKAFGNVLKVIFSQVIFPKSSFPSHLSQVIFPKSSFPKDDVRYSSLVEQCVFEAAN